MHVPNLRLGLVAGAAVILGGASIGIVAAAAAPSSPAASLVSAGATPGPSDAPASKPPRIERQANRAGRAARLLGIGRHLVHVEATVTDRDGNLIVVWLDHGIVQSVGASSVTVSETGGGTQTIATNGETVVRTARTDATLGDLKVGDEVFILSRVDGGNPLAKRIRIIPPAAAGTN